MSQVKKKVRTRTAKGTFKPDNKATPDVNEAWTTETGEHLTLADKARLFEIPYSTVYNRIHSLKWSEERALTTPVRAKKKKSKKKFVKLPPQNTEVTITAVSAEAPAPTPAQEHNTVHVPRTLEHDGFTVAAGVIFALMVGVGIVFAAYHLF